MTKIIDALNWRYATKKFDPEKKVSQEDIKIIEESLRLTPSSFWLQPWKFVWVKNTELKAKLVEHSWGQKQVIDASHLLILCRVNELWEGMVEDYIDDAKETTWATSEQLQGYKDMMLWFIQNTPNETLKTWADKQSYIAIWNLMTVLADMRIDSCPMEGFVKEKYDEILWLTDKWLSSVLVMPIWYRASDDIYATREKIRYTNEELFLEI